MNQILVALAAVLAMLTAGHASTPTGAHSTVARPADAIPPFGLHPMDTFPPTGL